MAQSINTRNYAAMGTHVESLLIILFRLSESGIFVRRAPRRDEVVELLAIKLAMDGLVEGHNQRARKRERTQGVLALATLQPLAPKMVMRSA
jgi:hypothetical protein